MIDNPEVLMEVRMARLEDGQERLEAAQSAIREEMRNGFDELKSLLRDRQKEWAQREAEQDREIFNLKSALWKQRYFVAGAIAAASFILECARRFFGW